MSFARAFIALVLMATLYGCGNTTQRTVVNQETNDSNVLTATDVQTVWQNAAASVNDALVIAVVDRAGHPLAVVQKPGAPAMAMGNFQQMLDSRDVALGLARTAAFFSNNQAPLSSRTVRFISGIHFPPGVANTGNAALYGIENTNRGCTLDPAIVSAVPPSLPVYGTAPAGIITGKKDVYDSDPTAVNPGGIPLFKNGQVVGGVGVVASTPEIAEFAALNGALNSGDGIKLPLPLPPPGAVLIDGVALPFAQQLTIPAGSSAGTYAGTIVDPAFTGVGSAIPDGDIIAPRAGAVGGLTAAQVASIVANAVNTANQTRAVIRLPIGQRARMVIAVSDLDGTLLALHRMPDATVFSIDVAASKARNMTYFNSQAVNPNDLPGVPSGTAVTNRTISFGAQPLYPPGIDGSNPGPFFQLYVNDTANPCTQGSQPAAGVKQSGIVFFPGSEGLYVNGVLVGGLGVSGDGVEQDDFVTAGGAAGFEPPTNMRADQIIDQGVRLPYMKFPRNPTQ